MTDKYIANIECPDCGSSTGVGVYEREDGTQYGNCFSCEKYFPDIDSNGYELNEEFVEVQKEHHDLEDSSYNSLKSRKISLDACKKYGVTSILKDGWDVAHFYPMKNGDGEDVYMYRDVLNKDFRTIGSFKNVHFFGQEECGSNGKMIIVTEGQLDTLAARDMLSSLGKNYRVCSIPNGVSAAVKAFKDNFEWINSFENILLCFDNDEPGRSAAKKVGELFGPNRVKIMVLPKKDANDMLVAGMASEFLEAVFSARESRPDGIVSISDIKNEAIKPPEYGLSFPWETLTYWTFGYRRKEVYGIGAGSGCGKTEAFKEMINHVIFYHNLPAGVFFLEEPAEKTAKVLAGKHFNKRFHIPADRGGDWTIDELESGIDQLEGKVYLYNHFGSKDWSSIKSKIKYMAISLGIKDFFLDHLTALVAQEDNEYTALNRIMEEMASLVQELDITIFYISHLRKASGTPHEEGGRVTADQFKGSGAIVFWSNFLFGLERNQQADTEEERNLTTFRVLKDRNSGLATGVTFRLKYHHDTGRWLEYDMDNEFDDEEFE